MVEDYVLTYESIQDAPAQARTCLARDEVHARWLLKDLGFREIPLNAQQRREFDFGQYARESQQPIYVHFANSSAMRLIMPREIVPELEKKLEEVNKTLTNQMRLERTGTVKALDDEL